MGASRVAKRAARKKRRPPRLGIGRIERLVSELGVRETARRASVGVGTLERWRREGASRAGHAALVRLEERREAALQAARTRERATVKGKAAKARRLELERKRKLAEVRAKATLREREKLEAARKQEAERRERAKQKELERARAKAAQASRQAEVALARKKLIEEARRRTEEGKRRAAAALEARKKAEEAAKLRRLEKDLERKALREAGKAKGDERDRRRGILSEACRLLDGSNVTLAQATGVSEATVRRWMKDPPMQSAAYDRLEKVVEEIHTLLSLMKAAGEVESLPKIRPGSGRRSGKKTDGVWWTRAVMRRLTPAVLRDIVKWASSRPGKFYPFWQVTLVTSQFAVHSGVDFDATSPKKTEKDYRTVIIQIGHQKWGDFAVFRPEPSSEKRSAGSAAQDLKERMTAKIEGGLVQVFVHAVTVFAYRRRSEAEASAWVTNERRERGNYGRE